MLFGWTRVGPRLHFTATALVAVGTAMSAFWIISANSWMQDPAGYVRLANGVLRATNWMQVIFSPTFPVRLVHMLLAAFLTTSLVVGAASSWRLLRAPEEEESCIALKMAIGMFAIVAPLQLLAGDMSGKQVLHVQPAKLAAIEAFWDTKAGQPFHIIAWPDQAAEANRWEIAIPKLGSLITAGDANAEIKGLKAFAPQDRPPVAIVFWSFRVMVGLGLAMIGLGLWGGYLCWRGSLAQAKWFQRASVAMGPAGFVAVVTGWIVAEVGRQPYVIYGVLRTADGVSPVTKGEVSVSLLAFMLIYAIVFSAGALYILRLIQRGPAAGASEPKFPAPRPPGYALAAAPAEPEADR
jgi:cytochrome d ubiquinol oxidase subunit I